jgi:hypothetical protein
MKRQKVVTFILMFLILLIQPDPQVWAKEESKEGKKKEHKSRKKETADEDVDMIELLDLLEHLDLLEDLDSLMEETDEKK